MADGEARDRSPVLPGSDVILAALRARFLSLPAGGLVHPIRKGALQQCSAKSARWLSPRAGGAEMVLPPSYACSDCVCPHQSAPQASDHSLTKRRRAFPRNSGSAQGEQGFARESTYHLLPLSAVVDPPSE